MKKILSTLCIFCMLNASNHEQQFNLACKAVENGEFDTALSLFAQVEQYFPNNVQLLCNIGFVLKKQNKMSQAIATYEKARALSAPTNSKVERAISHAYLALGDFERGWPAYEYRWVNPPAYNSELKKYIEMGGSLQNKIIVLHTEYGLGDTLQFIRYAHILKNMGATIIVNSPKPLVQLLSLCPYIDQVINADKTSFADFQALLMSLPYILQSKGLEIPTQTPYLFADLKLSEQWKAKLSQDKNYKIGICWQAQVHKDSNFANVQQDALKKSIALAQLAKLSQIPGVSLYSLQKMFGLEQLDQLPKDLLVHDLKDFDSSSGPFMDTAAIMQSLDLIITIDTSIAHLAGALGVPVWIILPYAADWRWQLDRTDSPWYPTMTLFRQSIPDNWSTVILNLIKTLISEKLAQQKNINENYVLESTALNLLKLDELYDAYDLYQKVLIKKPNNANAINNCAYIASRINKPEQSIYFYKKFLELEPSKKHAQLGLAKAMLAAGDLQNGWPQFEWRFPNPKEYQQAFGYYNIKPSDLKGKRILIRAEWGFGDMMQFVRYAMLCKEAGAAHVIIQTFEPLKQLFSISAIADQIIAVGDPIPDVDIQIPCLSLPMIFDTTLKNIPAPIPYLKADPQLIAYWRNILNDSKYKIGICWRAKQIGFIEDFKTTRRSIAVENLKPLLDLPAIAFYNLQKDITQEEKNVLQQAHVKIFDQDFDEKHGRFMDTAAVMMNLDLIITADTSTAHLAAGLGKKVWLLLPFCAEWRWGIKGNTSPWYPKNLRLFRQKKPGEWKDVIEEVKKEIEKIEKERQT